MNNENKVVNFNNRINDLKNKNKKEITHLVKDILDETVADLSIKLRPYQERVCLRAIENSLNGISSSLIVSPTGSGKTIIGLTIAKALNKFLGLNVGWSAMRKNLLHQANEENINRGFGISLSLISMFEKNPPLDVDVLFVDEAHHDATTSMALIHGMIKPVIIIGLSATPMRTDKVGLAFKKTIKDAGIYELIREGVLACPEHYTIKKWTPDEVAATYIKSPEKWGQSIMFFKRVDECHIARDILSNHGIEAEVVTASTDRLSQIERFESGQTKVLLNVNILTEGFDHPALETVFCRPTVRGLTLQICGRVLRRFEDLTKKIVQCEDTEHPFTALATAKNSFILSKKGRWIALKPKETLNAEIKETIQKLTERTIDISAVIELRHFTNRDNRSLRQNRRRRQLG